MLNAYEPVFCPLLRINVRRGPTALTVRSRNGPLNGYRPWGNKVPATGQAA